VFRKLTLIIESLNILRNKGLVSRIQQFLEAPDHAEDLKKYVEKVDNALREYEVMILFPVLHYVVLINCVAVFTAGYI
jgi:hypothetical protein